jgi:hypothetical protein
VRFSTGTGTLRGDLRLQQAGNSLSGTLAVEPSDEPPASIRDGRIAANGSFGFSVDGAVPMRFTGSRAGATLVGQATLERGAAWSWSAQRLADGTEFYATLPRFRSRQLVIGNNVTELRLPGAWVAAADSAPRMAVRADQLATAAGLPPIAADSVDAVGFYPALGLYQRAELAATLTAAMTAVRAALPAASQAPFDALFRPRGVWLLDLHDVALATARRQVRTASWDGAQPAVTAAGLVPSGLPPGVATVPLALYRVAALRERDPRAYEAARERLSLGGAASAQVAEAILDGYRDAAIWQGQAVEFLLSAAWVPAAAGPTSPAALVRATWGRPDLPLPRIRPYYFGYPEAEPRVATPPAVVARIVEAENWTGEEWARRRGAAGLLAVLRQLDPGVGTHTTLEAGGPSVLTSVARRAAATPAGFLEPADEVLEDPGNVPLMAVATAVHEWQHIVMEGDRLALSEGGAIRPGAGGLTVNASDPFLAEGFAEWMTEQILGPVIERQPVVGLGEARKLAVLEAGNPNDPHVLGLRMLRALARTTGNAALTRSLILAHAEDPAAVAEAVPSWRGWRVRAVALPARGERRLVPETRFTIEDGVGDVTETWIRVAP